MEIVSLVRDQRTLVYPANVRVLRIAHDDRDLRIRLAPGGPSPVRRVAFRLEGHDAGWITRDPPGEQAYDRLAPGSYRLLVAAQAVDGHWSRARALGLVVDPPWWRSQRVLALGGLAVLAASAWAALSHRARRRRREAWQLEQASRRLAEQQSAAKSRFLATLGHEIRTPMTGVLGMAELLQGGSLDPVQSAQVDAIQRAGRHLLRLVNDALDLARIEAGKLVLDDAPFELRPLLDEVSGLLRPLASAKGLGFSLACDGDVPRAFRGDATRVRQILFNLGHNAIKFCDRGEVSARVSAPPPLGLRLVVHDSGPGLSSEQQARLFRRFEPGMAREPGGYGGSGLGLAICQELAAAMGGAISVRSEPGQGAEFCVELPLPAAELPPAPAPASLPQGAALRLLLVEDDDVVAEVVSGLLRRQGHAVAHVPHGLAAISELACREFDLALLDLDLPGIDGTALARLIRAGGSRMPLLALTARADAEAEPSAMASGMNGFLRKPVTGDMLAAALAAAAGPR
ncbi:ATP-binding protein [Arenimonas sp. MALMAid1274]|uniref:ATP-binding protein n=1 Tax=Arenimonas sp. MALMAid1274 TaxID=3411630 RepID=UPI003BA2E1D8